MAAPCPVVTIFSIRNFLLIKKRFFLKQFIKKIIFFKKNFFFILINFYLVLIIFKILEFFSNKTILEIKDHIKSLYCIFLSFLYFKTFFIKKFTG